MNGRVGRVEIEKANRDRETKREVHIEDLMRKRKKKLEKRDKGGKIRGMGLVFHLCLEKKSSRTITAT